MMKYLVGTIALISLAGCNTAPPQEIDTTSPGDVTSYTFGHQAGVSVKNGLEDQQLDKDLFLLGVQDALQGKSPRHALTDEEVSAAHTEYNDKITELKEQEAIVAGEKNALEGAAFLENYSKGKNVASLDNGILYTVLSSGQGNRNPSVEDSVEVHYEGTLIDGSVFDSSLSRGTPVSIELSRVIPGWQKAITNMTEGDEWEVVIPSSQAYGASGRAPAIGPNQTLVFKIELIEIL